MNLRHQIKDDNRFWTYLEFEISGWLANSTDKELRKYWVDGFIPEFLKNTKYGVNVEGIVWIVEGQKKHHKWRFLAMIPQKLLYGKIQSFDYEISSFDIQSKFIELTIAYKKQNTKS